MRRAYVLYGLCLALTLGLYTAMLYNIWAKPHPPGDALNHPTQPPHNQQQQQQQQTHTIAAPTNPPHKDCPVCPAHVCPECQMCPECETCQECPPPPPPPPAPVNLPVATEAMAPREFLNGLRKEVDVALAQNSFPRSMLMYGDAQVFDLFEPVYQCMLKEDRIGNLIDGGKWMCGADLIRAPCVAYSLGCFGVTDFERNFNIITHNQCEVHVFDPAHYNLGTLRATYHQVRIGRDEPYRNEKSLQTIMNELGHTHLDVLKMDIEGSEWDTIPALCNQTTFPWIGHLLLEVHWQNKDRHSITSMQVVQKTWKIFQCLESHGLQLFHREPNVYGSLADVAATEYAFRNLNPKPV